MTGNSNYVFRALARALGSSAGRRLAISAVGALAIGLLPTMAAPAPSHVHLAATPVASGSWLTRLNSWRTSTGVPALTENAVWSQGDYNHGLYMVKNDLVTHYETPGTPYYTPEGDAAAQASNIYVSSSTGTTDDQAIDWWMGAPFHAMGLMDPRLAQTGFGAYREVKSGWQLGAAVDVLRGNPFSGGQFPIFFPGNGTSEPLTSYSGYEYPDPLQNCPGYSMPTGLPVFLELGGHISTTAGAVHSFTGNGVALAHCVIDSTNSSVASYMYERGGVIVVPRQPLLAGVNYVVALTVNGVPYTWSFSVGPFLNCSTASLTPAAPPPAPVGTTIAFTASSTGCVNPRYEFWVLYPDGSWNLKQGWGGPSFSWNTTGLASGVYTIHAWANHQGTGYDAIGSATVTLTGCTSASLNPPNPTAPAGNPVNFTASSGGCTNPVYEFFVQYPDGSWNLKRGWGGATFSWDTSGLAPGVYTVHAWVSTQGNGHDAIGSATVTLTGCNSATLSPANSTQSSGSTVAFTAGSIACPNAEYEFFVQYPDGSWNLKQAWGGATFNWDTTGLAPGVYTIHAWVNMTGTGHDAIGSSTVTLTGCTSASLSPTNPSVPAGSTVNFTAGSTGCPKPQYAFYVQYPDGTWYLKQGFGGPAFSWNTTGLLPGTYVVHAWASASGAGHDAIGESIVTLTGCASAALSPPTVSQAAGTTVNLTASAIGCFSPQFQFFVLYPNGNWYLKQGWGGPTFNWDTATLAPGTYVVHGWASVAASGHDAIGEATVTLTGCASASVSPSSGSGTVGTKVTFTVTSSGCPTPVYEFFVQFPDGSWHLMKAFSTGNTWQWDSAALPKGSYVIHVWANNQGADTSTYETIGSATYILT